MTRIYLYSLILFGVITTSCEKEIELEADEIAPRLVINSAFTYDDTCWLDMTESRSAVFNGPLPTVNDATATLLDENENVLGTFTNAGDGRYYLVEPVLAYHQRYQLKASAPNLNEISASSEIPSPTPIVSIDTVRTINGSETTMEFTVNLTDNGSLKNYYAVSFELWRSYYDFATGDTVFQPISNYALTRENVVVNGSRDVDGSIYGTEFFFNDDTFQGGAFSFKGEAYLDIFDEKSFFIVKLRTLSEELFRYGVTYSNYMDAEYDFFAEPVQVYSNIKNGFGIFGGQTMVTDTIRYQ